MKKIFIIAEAGVNHNGDMEIARRLIDAASDSGADAVKFQTFQARELVCRTAQKARYQLCLFSHNNHPKIFSCLVSVVGV